MTGVGGKIARPAWVGLAHASIARQLVCSTVSFAGKSNRCIARECHRVDEAPKLQPISIGSLRPPSTQTSQLATSKADIAVSFFDD